jgi:transcription antitermination factor NusG
MNTAVSVAKVEHGAPSIAGQPHWHAACTFPRHEKRVFQCLRDRGIDCLLPLYQAVHDWKDRRKIVELPLFPGYVFVHVPAGLQLAVLRTPSVARFVSFSEGRPAEIPDEQVQFFHSDVPFAPHPFLAEGDRIRVRRGCLAGAEGILVRRKQSLRFVLSVELLQRAVSVEIDADDIEPIR